MGRTVTDAAIVLGAIALAVRARSSAGACRATTGRPFDRARCAARGSASTGAISRASTADDGLEPRRRARVRDDGGARCDAGRHRRAVGLASRSSDDEITVLLTEFKAGMDAYLAALAEHSPALARRRDRLQRRPLRGRAPLLRPGAARGGRRDERVSTTRPIATARARCLAATRTNGIDRILAATASTRSSAPAYGDSSGPAVSGYPVDLGPDRADRGRTPGRRVAVGRLPRPSRHCSGSRSTSKAAVEPRPRPTFRRHPPPEPRQRRASARRPSSHAGGPSGATSPTTFDTSERRPTTAQEDP